MELINNVATATRRLTPCSAGVGERTREGNDLYDEMIESKVIAVERDKDGHPVYRRAWRGEAHPW